MEQSIKHLRKAELEVSKAIQLAAESHNWSLVSGLTEVAKRLSEFSANNARSPAQPSPDKDLQKKDKKQRSSQRGSRKSQYPKYYVEDRTLFKVGWSKKSKKEYIQKVETSIVEAIISKYFNSVGAGNKFQIPDLLPIPDDKGSHYSDYLVYLAFGLLKSEEFFVEHERGTFSSADSLDNMKSRTRTLLESLPSFKTHEQK